MIRLTTRALVLFAIWLVLSASYEVFHLVAGALLALLVSWLNQSSMPSAIPVGPWMRAPGYCLWLFGRILASGLHVSRLILSPSLPIAPKLIRHRTELEGNGSMVLMGNSITLTPGTITVEIQPGELVVHAIDGDSGRDLSQGILEERVGRVFDAQERAR